MRETSPIAVREAVDTAGLAAGEWRAKLSETGRYFHERGWSVGTSSNYSVVISRDPLQLLITASGKDKGRLSMDDFVIVDAQGKSIDPAMPKPSAETLIHTMLAESPDVNAVLHTHSVWGTLLSEVHEEQGGFWLEGYEMLKGLAGIGTHEHRQWVTVFDNSQDIAKLSGEIAERIQDVDNPLRHGFLLLRHGLYTWGADLDEARRHIEIFEFLFEVVGRKTSFAAGI